MNENLRDDDDTSNALDALVAAIRRIEDPALRENALSRVESVLDSLRLDHDVTRGAPAEARQARWWLGWLRHVAQGVESGGSMLPFWRSELAKFEALHLRKSSADIQRSIARQAAFRARYGAAHDCRAGAAGEEERTAAWLASYVASEVKAPIDHEQGRALLRAFRRRQGERAHGEPSREEAIYAILAPHNHAQSVESVRKNLQRAK